MKILHECVSLMYVNAYVYYDEDTLEAAIIDPGGEGNKLINLIKEHGFKLKAILLTHGHFDHIGAVNAIKAEFNTPIYIHEGDKEIVESPEHNASSEVMRKPIIVKADKLITDGEIINIGKGQLKVIHTPGHTNGGVCYYDENNAVLFSGDTLFNNSIGRTDFVFGNTENLYSSIREKLFSLPDNVQVLTGHGEPTGIGYEKSNNPFVGLN